MSIGTTSTDNYQSLLNITTYDIHSGDLIISGLTSDKLLYLNGSSQFATANNGTGILFSGGTLALDPASSPTFAGLTIGALNGVLKATAGVIGTTVLTTDDIGEGKTNLYFTNARARGALSNGTGIGYDNSTGVFSNSGVTSITGTANQVIRDVSTGAVTLSLPQSINNTANVQFSKLALGSVNSTTTQLYITADTNTTAITAYAPSVGRWGGIFQNSTITSVSLAGSTYAALFQGGNVGIGNNTPTYKLDVTGGIRATSAAQFDSTLTANGLISGLTGITSYSYVSVPSVNGYMAFNSATDGSYAIQCAYGGGYYPLRFVGSSDNGTQRLFEYGHYTGDVATNTWNKRFSINSYSGQVIQNAAASALTDYGMITSQDSSSRGFTMGYDSSANQSWLYSRNVGIDGTTFNINNTLYVTKPNTGYVGIGTISPGAQLELYKYSPSADQTGGGIILSRYSFAGPDYRAAALYSRYISGIATDCLCFGVSTGSNPYSEFSNCKMVLTSTAKLGVGTTTPAANIDVTSTATTFLRGSYSGGNTLQFVAGSSYTAIAQSGAGGILFCTNSDGSLTNPSSERLRITNSGSLSVGGNVDGASITISGSSAYPIPEIALQGNYSTDGTMYHRIGVGNQNAGYNFYVSQNIKYSSANNRWEFVNSGGWGGYGAMMLFPGSGSMAFYSAWSSGGLPSFNRALSFGANANVVIDYNLAVGLPNGPTATNGYNTGLDVSARGTAVALRVQDSVGSGRGYIQIGSHGTASNNCHFGCEGDGAFYIWNGLFAGGSNRMLKATAAGRIEDRYGFVQPVGVIIAFGGTSAPTGWLMCDGSAVSRTTYADLFAVISTNYGNGNGSTTFNVPDCRGLFLRGRDGGRGLDPDRMGRVSVNGGQSQDNPGSFQYHAIQHHTHETFLQGRFAANHWNGGNQVLNSDGAGSVVSKPDTGYQTSGNASGETRPSNLYVNYIIKF